MFALITLSSCATLKHADRIVTDYTIDYTAFNDDEFLITPYRYTHEYNAVGDLRMVIVPALKGNFVKQGGSDRYIIAPENITYQEMAGMAIAKARRMGADALVDFRITVSSRTPDRKGNRCWYEYVVSGFCIQRKALQVKVTE